MSRFALLATVALGAAFCAMAWAAATGVGGRVTVSPRCAGPQLRDQDCAAPLVNARVLLTDGSGKTIGAATTSAEGRFEIDAPVGSYRVEVAGGKRLPRCTSVAVTVVRGKRSEVEIDCDSGMR